MDPYEEEENWDRSPVEGSFFEGDEGLRFAWYASVMRSHWAMTPPTLFTAAQRYLPAVPEPTAGVVWPGMRSWQVRVNLRAYGYVRRRRGIPDCPASPPPEERGAAPIGVVEDSGDEDEGVGMDPGDHFIAEFLAELEDPGPYEPPLRNVRARREVKIRLPSCIVFMFLFSFFLY